MIKRFHEAPISIFKKVQELTDGDYALVHLLDANEEYRNLFFEARDMGREIILDNSVYELGPNFDSDKYAYWIYTLRPTYYIVPDVPEDSYAHISKFLQFIKKYPSLPGKRIGVVQGESLGAMLECYRTLEPLCDKIAISMNYNAWKRSNFNLPTEPQKLIYCRQSFLDIMDSYNLINRNKPHHLLGVQLPQELRYYGDHYSWIDSVDTSNPIVHGYEGVRYDGFRGLRNKSTTLLHSIIDASVTEDQWQDIKYNINMFRRICDDF